MRHTLGRKVRAALGAVALCAVLAGCGGGGGGGGAFTTISFDNSPASTQAIVKVDFDFFDVSLLSDRVVSTSVAPGESVSFDFDQFETENLNDVTLTWSDLSTTNISLIPVAVFGGGDFSYPVAH